MSETPSPEKPSIDHAQASDWWNRHKALTTSLITLVAVVAVTFHTVNRMDATMGPRFEKTDQAVKELGEKTSEKIETLAKETRGEFKAIREKISTLSIDVGIMKGVQAGTSTTND